MLDWSKIKVTEMSAERIVAREVTCEKIAEYAAVPGRLVVDLGFTSEVH